MVYKILLSLICLGSALLARAQSDNCISATSLTECVIFNGNNSGATISVDDSYSPIEICATTTDNSVWFTFTASTTGAYTFSISNFVCSGSSTLETGIFSGSCGSLTPINCETNSANITTVFNATAGTNYFIVVDGTLGSDCTFDAILCPGCNIIAGFNPSVTTGAYPLTVSFTNTSIGAQFSTWNFGELTPGFDGTNSIYTYDEPGTYYVTLTVFNGVCIDTITDTIVVTGPSAIEIPNVFTPNADNENDLFTINCFGIKTLDVQIFNRWGEMVGTWSGVNGWWDGFSTLAGIKVSEGTYFYMVKAEGNDGTLFDEKGYLQLFR